jgi:hypothetical protein
MFLIQSGGKVYNKVNNPAAVYDSRHSVLLKLGEVENMQEYYNALQNRYRAFGLHNEADDICLMELPHDQEEIDKVFGICDYIGKLHKRMILH